MYGKILLAAAALPFVAALQDSDVQSVFPGTTDLTTLTSGSYHNSDIFVTAVANSSHVLIVCNRTSTAIDGVGWIGHGLGTGMPNADILVLWPNSDGSWTFSHRQPANHVLPTPIPYTTSPWSVVSSLTTTQQSGTSWTSVGFVRPLTFPASDAYTTTSTHTTWQAAPGQPIVWSYSDTNPDSTDPSAVIVQHDNQGLGSIDLSQPYVPTTTTSGEGSGSSGSSSSSSGTTQGSPSTQYNKLILAHAVFGSLTFLIISPMAILIGRNLRQITWFPAHMWLQIITLVFVWITFSLGYSAAKDSKFNEDTHHKIGLVLPLVTSAQGAIGAWAHWSKRDSARPRPGKNWLHVVLGLGVQGLGYTQVRLGYAEWTMTAGEGEGRIVPHGVIIVFWLLLGLECAGYLVGVVQSPKTFLGRPNAAATKGTDTEK